MFSLINLFIYLLIYTLLAFANEDKIINQNYQTERVCHFPENEERPFFVDIPSGPPPRSILLDTVVEPPDANLEIANIRSNNLAQELINDWLSLEKRPNGQFLLFSNDIISQQNNSFSHSSLTLLSYPSTINESLLYITVKCNGRFYPLITIRLLAHNLHAPEWWIHGMRVTEDSLAGEISIPKNSKTFGSLFDTQLLALDQEPSEYYPITFSVESPYNNYFSIELVNCSSLPISEQVKFLSTLSSPYSKRIEDWHEQQLPPKILLKLLDNNILKEKEQLIINIIASDNGIPEERKSKVKLRFLLLSEEQNKTNNLNTGSRFSKSIYFGNYTKEMKSGTEIIPSEPINALFPLQRAGDRIIYDLDISSNPYAALFQIEQDSGRIRLVEHLPEQPPSNIELDILATLLPKNSTLNRQIIRSKLSLTDRTEIKLTYFTQCHYSVHLAENPSAFTRVLQFNFKGDVEGIELINGTELFKVDNYGLLSVLPGVDIDREKIERIVIKAKLKINKLSIHPKSLELCQIATAEILIDDVNDHSPKFTQRAYRFRIDPFPYNNTEVGSLRAVDGDADEFGHLRYRILDEFVSDGHGGEEPLPFVLFQADGAATLFFVIKPMHLQLFQQPYRPQSEYTFTVEAYDSDEDPRTARVSVNVRIEEEQITEKDSINNQKHNSLDEQELLDEVKRERKHYRSATNEEFNDLETKPKAWATRIRTVDKDVPEIFIRHSDTNLFKNKNHQKLFNEIINFSQEHYIFRMSGNLFEGQTIGWISIIKRKMNELIGDNLEGQEENKEEGNEKLLIEYAVEEGIDGFVGVNMSNGRLFVGSKLVGGSERFEEIRFSVAAIHPSNGRILATALVSVIFDETNNNNQPYFDRQIFNFEIDLFNLKHFPTLLGQIQAEIKTNNSEINLIEYLIQNEENEKENYFKDLFSIGRESGKIHLMRKPTEIELNKENIKFKVYACSNLSIPKDQHYNNCAEALVNVVFLNEKKQIKKRIFENQTNEQIRVLTTKKLEETTTLQTLPLSITTISLNSLNQIDGILEFIPLPKTLFLAPTKPPGSTILRLSVRTHDPTSGTWHLIPNGLEDNNNIPKNLHYWVEGEGENLFTIHGNSLILKFPLSPGQWDMNLRARLQRKGKISVAEHKLRIIAIGDEEPQLYPVFEKINHEFHIDPEGHFPVIFPPLNASLAGGGTENIRFNLFPARSNDQINGVEIHPKTGQLRVRRIFLNHFQLENGGEVFLVVRAINQGISDKQQQYFSDASVSLIVKPKIISLIKFESTLYRYILSERQLAGTILENGPPIRIVEPNLHPNIRIRLAASPQSVWALKHFGLMPNGSLLLKEQLDIERMSDNSQGLINMEVVAEDISLEGGKGIESRAKIEIQLIDNNEFIPIFSPPFPLFNLHPESLFAGYPIGKLSVKDNDFTDRQGDTLNFRSISGNASHFVHLQRDGQLLIKDQNAALPGIYTLLVEVQDFGGLSARTTVTFVLSNFEESFTSSQPIIDLEIEEKGTTIEFPLPSFEVFEKENNLKPILSVRDSIDWENMKKINKNMSEDFNYFLEENNYNKGLFRMDKNSGQLFLKENVNFDKTNMDDEYELKIRVERPMEEGNNEKNNKERSIILRRVYTVRLVPINSEIIPINNITSFGTTKLFTNEAKIEDEMIRTTTIENNLKELLTSTTNIFDENKDLNPTIIYSSTFSPTLLENTSLNTIEETTTINEFIEEELTTINENKEITNNLNILNKSLLSSSTLKTPPSARPLEFSSTNYLTTPTINEFISTTTKTIILNTSISSKTFPTSLQPFTKSENLRFALPRYHWLLNNPENNILIGKLDIINNENNKEILNNFEMVIDPPQFRQWFKINSKNGDLYLNEVPKGLFGRQRAEFHINLVNQSSIIAETRVTVDLSLPNNDALIIDKNEETKRTTTKNILETTLEISESFDQEGTSLNSLDNIQHFTVSATPMQDIDNQNEFNQKLKFGSSEFKAMLPEGRYGNSGAQLTIRPFPLSTRMPKGIKYSIIEIEDNNIPLPFFVHSDSGELIAFAEIDREEKALYRFRVKAFDPNTGQNALTLVTVQILDVNDNFPHFLEPLIWTIPITRNTPLNSKLAIFQAEDNDEGQHGRIHFKIEKDTSGGLFNINSKTGELFVAKAIPNENIDPRDQFEIIISALDGGRPSLRTEHNIRIEVFPEGNEFSTPEFLRSEYNAGRIAGVAAQNGTFIFQVTAGISKQICYELIEPPIAKLFVINKNNGQLFMGRRPLDSERGHQFILNISAHECHEERNQHNILHNVFTTVKIQLDHLPIINNYLTTTTTIIGLKEEIDSETNLNNETKCHFSQQIFNTEIAENTEGRQRLLILNIIGNCQQKINCLLNQSNEAFELINGINNNNKYCELFVIQPLDREKKSLQFLVINISYYENNENKSIINEIKLDSSENEGINQFRLEENEKQIKRMKRKNGRLRQNKLKDNGHEVVFNGLVEQIKSKLAYNQALVVVRVIDRNDNEPQIKHLTIDGQLVFAVDWQTPLLQPIGRVSAYDPDEQPKQLQFYLEGESSSLFSINSTSGVIQLMKSLQTENSDEYSLSVSVSDGEHTVQTPITIYKLQPGTNIALLVINKSEDQVDVLNFVRYLNALLPSFDVNILVKQVYIGDNGIADPKRTHLLVYAQDKQTRIPLTAIRLKELIDSSLIQSEQQHSDSSIQNLKISDSPLQYLASVQVPDYNVWSSTSSFKLNSTEIILLSISAFLIFGICTMLYLLLRCCKRKQELITKSDLEYMVDSHIAGPRPYNVELITRKAMQNAQNLLKLPEPIEDYTMTPESRATMLASSGIYSSNSGSLGGPLRRTNRETLESDNNEEPEYSPTIPKNQRIKNNYNSGEISSETLRSEAEEINDSTKKESPQTFPSDNSKELRN